MGSTYFYLEFLLAYFTLLTPHYRNPAIFALEYTLVPDASYPTQLDQTTAGYFHILSRLPNSNSSRICIAGDSAGATLVLSFLLSLSTNKTNASPQQQQRPGFATLISPWASLISDRNRNTRSDYLNANSLHLYGSQYAGHPANLSSFLVSPGACTKGSIWAKAVPSGGMTIMYGSEEVLGPEIRELVLTLRGAGVGVSVKEEPGGIHAWVVARVFLEGTLEGRVKGLRDLIGGLRRAIPRVGEEGEEGIMET
ncbi:hypothetical protein MMC14_003433 [Varicellaria rhodocarpa]|nr:hypothetical protein [Varicellaria rhodocarpa]